jgi:hypothetical protein
MTIALDMEKLKELYIARMPLTRIAEELGSCTEVIKKNVKALGLSREKLVTPVKDITGIKFGRVTPLRPVKRDKFGKAMWLVRCDCGREKVINSSGLLAGLVLSCGCLKREYFSTGYKELSGAYWHKMEKSAAQRSFDFTITKEWAWNLYEQQNRKCALSGVPILLYPNNDRYRLQTASLDRIDSSKGYIEGNLQWVHKRVNFLKRNYPEKELVFWCTKIAEVKKALFEDFLSKDYKEKRKLHEDFKLVETS